mmetsp:Transcript_11923/g.27464  ORF Transcript_11923/g.27464 Transcript_11923/m.27464 type:complete len:250 (-) Transcript_11923:686-1435(-)
MVSTSSPQIAQLRTLYAVAPVTSRQEPGTSSKLYANPKSEECTVLSLMLPEPHTRPGETKPARSVPAAALPCRTVKRPLSSKLASMCFLSSAESAPLWVPLNTIRTAKLLMRWVPKLLSASGIVSLFFFMRPGGRSMITDGPTLRKNTESTTLTPLEVVMPMPFQYKLLKTQADTYEFLPPSRSWSNMRALRRPPCPALRNMTLDSVAAPRSWRRKPLTHLAPVQSVYDSSYAVTSTAGPYSDGSGTRR